MAKQPKWLRFGQRLKIDAEIAHIADDGSYLALELTIGGQRVRIDTIILEGAIEDGRVTLLED